MRILLISAFFPPQHAIAAQFAWCNASTWAATGEDVTVLTVPKRPDQCGPDRPHNGFAVVTLSYSVPKLLERLRRFEKTSPAPTDASLQPAKRRSLGRSIARNFRQRTGIFSGVRMPDLTDYWVRSAIEWASANASNDGWDLVYTVGGPYTSHLIGRELRRRGHTRRWVAAFNDLWTRNHLFSGLFPFTIRERHLEKSCLQEADAVVTVSEGCAAILQQSTTAPVKVIYNGYESALEDTLPSENCFSKSVSPKNAINLVFTGTFYPPWQNPLPLLNALKQLQTTDLKDRFHLHVAGFNSKEWAAACHKIGLENVLRDHGLVDFQTARWMQRDADALIYLDFDQVADGILPSRLFEYIAANAPILVIGQRDNTSAVRLVNQTRRGRHVPQETGRLLQTLQQLITNPSQFRNNPDSNLIAELSRESQAQRLLEFLKQVSQQSGAATKASC